MYAYSFQQQIKKLIAGPVFVKRVQQVSGYILEYTYKELRHFIKHLRSILLLVSCGSTAVLWQEIYFKM